MSFFFGRPESSLGIRAPSGHAAPWFSGPSKTVPAEGSSRHAPNLWSSLPALPNPERERQQVDGTHQFDSFFYGASAPRKPLRRLLTSIGLNILASAGSSEVSSAASSSIQSDVPTPLGMKKLQAENEEVVEPSQKKIFGAGRLYQCAAATQAFIDTSPTMRMPMILNTSNALPEQSLHGAPAKQHLTLVSSGEVKTAVESTHPKNPPSSSSASFTAKETAAGVDDVPLVKQHSPDITPQDVAVLQSTGGEGTATFTLSSLGQGDLGAQKKASSAPLPSPSKASPVSSGLLADVSSSSAELSQQSVSSEGFNKLPKHLQASTASSHLSSFLKRKKVSLRKFAAAFVVSTPPATPPRKPVDAAGVHAYLPTWSAARSPTQIAAAYLSQFSGRT
jgi:hypothetical protein